MTAHTLDNLEHLIVDRQEPVAIVTVHRPRVLNALASGTLDELRRVMVALRDDDAVRVVVITGSGEKAFVAGADIGELTALSPARARQHALDAQAVLTLIERLGKPVIAAINGYALGGGCELAMACTIRLAAETARIGQPEVNLGLIPGYGGTQRLARLVGTGRALELLLTGDAVSAAEAHRLGLVNRVLPAADLMRETLSLAASLAAKPSVAVRYILDAVRCGQSMPLPEAQIFEASLFGLVSSTDDMREGTRAFLEKRPAAFQGH